MPLSNLPLYEAFYSIACWSDGKIFLHFSSYVLSIFNVLIFFEKINNICKPFISSGMVKRRFIFISPENSFSNDEIQSVISFDPETRKDQRDNSEHLNRACTCLPREEPRMSNAIVVVSSCLALITKGRTLIFVQRTCIQLLFAIRRQ